MYDAGLHFVVEPSGSRLNEHEKRILSELRPVGIIFRSRNFLQGVAYNEWLECYKSLVSEIKECIARPKLLFCIDHEGGRVIRPPAPITRFPYAAFWKDNVEEVSKAMAIELCSLGINVNFAPVLDIHSNPENPVINQRAFATTADEVSKLALKFMQAHQNQGILTCGKHYPGHGDTKSDSHFELPVVNLTKEELVNRELKPFKKLGDAGIPLIMSAHVIYTGIDKADQATLSRKILHDLLRNELGYKGTIIADGLGMKAISSKLSQEETVQKAINASLDLFLVVGDSVNLDVASKLAGFLSNLIKSKKLKVADLERSKERIEKLVEQATSHTIHQLDQAIFDTHATLAEKLNNSCSNIKEFDFKRPGFE